MNNIYGDPPLRPPDKRPLDKTQCSSALYRSPSLSLIPAPFPTPFFPQASSLWSTPVPFSLSFSQANFLCSLSLKLQGPYFRLCNLFPESTQPSSLTSSMAHFFYPCDFPNKLLFVFEFLGSKFFS